MQSMTQVPSVHHDFEAACAAAGDAPRLAAAAALLEMGDRLGLLAVIAPGRTFTLAELSTKADLPVDGVAGYCEALESAGLIVAVGGSSDEFEVADSFEVLRHQAGFISWTMNANRPFIENARDFLTDPNRGSGIGLRDGREVAVSSQWMGSRAFYPTALSAIMRTRPQVAVDLGAGTCRLLIEILLDLPESRAVGLDLDSGACIEAANAAERAGVADRLRIVERSIQSIATDPEPLEGADVIHAGFVFHDMMQDEEETADAVLARCFEALRPGGLLAVTEAVPYVRNERERLFSAVVTYYHQQFMKRRLLTEAQWVAKLRGLGFVDVQSIELPFPTGRLFLAVRDSAATTSRRAGR